MRMTVRTSNSEETIKDFFRKAHHFKPYFRLRFYNDMEKINNYYDDVYFGNKKTRVLMAFSGNAPVGLVAWRISDWDAEVFGFKIAHIVCVAAIGGYQKEVMIKTLLLKNVIDCVRDENIRLISSRIDADDFSSIHVWEENDFRVMDNLLTYIYKGTPIRKEKMFPLQIKQWFKVEIMKNKHIKEAYNLISERYITGHYFNDPDVPVVRARAMYKKWLETKLKDRASSDIFVVTRDGKVVGCSIFSCDNLLSRYCGLKSLHKGLVVVASSAAGSLLALINAQIEKRKGLNFAEFETQSNNYKMLEVMQKLGMRCIQSRYTFHRTV